MPNSSNNKNNNSGNNNIYGHGNKSAIFHTILIMREVEKNHM